MIEVIQLALLVVGSVSVIAGAIIAAWRLIPQLGIPAVPQQRLRELEEALEALRLVQLDFADKYEITMRRNNTRVGRLRRKLAHERGEDEPEEEEDDTAQLPLPVPVADLPGRGNSKAELWSAFNQKKGQT